MRESFFDLKSEKQDRMINASLHMFAVNGYKHASTDDIVKEAGISKGLLFHYFDSKAGLYAFLLNYSIRYLLFEYGRYIEDETDYFEYHLKLEQAKLNVLRNYPYMYGFIDGAMSESQIAIRQMSLEDLNRYEEAMDNYKNRLRLPELKDGVEIEQVENLISFTIKGLTDAQLESGNPSADLLYEQVSEYINLIRNVTVKR